MPPMTQPCKTLILFTRYPQPGATKTRLIPALGAQGAAELHQRMAERVLQQALSFSRTRGVALEIHFAGGEESAMRQWLGQHTFSPQGEGSVGDRMAHSFKNAFDAGVSQAVIIGSDCPGLTAKILENAFDALESCDLVLGPARDGGYYLIGLTQARPALFTGIAWGTEAVLNQTLAKAHALTIKQLTPLHDIDRPEDLAHLDHHPHSE